MIQLSGVLSDVSAALPPAGCSRCPAEVKQCSSVFDAKSLFPFRRNGLISSRLEVRQEKFRNKSFAVRASGRYNGDLNKVAPLEMETPVGQMLTQILLTSPLLLQVTADLKLEELQGEKKATAPSSQNLLYKRIAEVKEADRRKSLEEIMYCLVVGRFVSHDIRMIPKISATSDLTGRVDHWPTQEEELESVHSSDAFEMILNHLALILGDRAAEPPSSIIQISKIKLGKLYAASIMYGYFLKRVDERYQLERSMNTLPEGFGEDPVRREYEEPNPENQLWVTDLIQMYPDNEGGGIIDSSKDDKAEKLRSYVMYLDAETLQKYATIRSKEAVSLIEKQTQSLFGKPEITVTQGGSLDAANDEVVSLTSGGLTMLILEAVAFGSFLWDTENHVESKYSFLKS